MIKKYYDLTKPRMVYMNVLVAFAAFVFASEGKVNWKVGLFLLAGLGLVVASACVFNNIYDKAIDARMERTKNRAVASGTITSSNARLYAFILLFLGVIMLYFTNMLTAFCALVGFFVYVFLYTPLKTKSGLALFVGAVAGAMPPVVGYVAATNTLDLYALALFAFLFLWQIPHFLAIARYRFDDYHNAGVPLLVEKPQSDKARAQARKIFHASLVVLLVFCIGLMLHK